MASQEPTIQSLKNVVEATNKWTHAFSQWQSTSVVDSATSYNLLLKQLFELRSNAYALTCNGICFHAWLPTVLNQVVAFDGREFLKNPRYRCFHELASFDIVCNKTVPYAIQYIEIDMVEDWGTNSKKQFAEKLLKTILRIGDFFGVPVRMFDHACTGATMLPSTFLMMLCNPKTTSTHPKQYGFRRMQRENPKTRQTVLRLTQWRLEHAEQLVHFINPAGKLRPDRITELTLFLQDRLPADLQTFCTKLTLTEYIKIPKTLKRTTVFGDQIVGNSILNNI